MSSNCEQKSDNRNLEDAAWFAAYYVAMPIYFLVGVSGHVTLIIAFHRQAKKEKAYAYQVYLTFSKLLEIFTFSLFMFTYKWFSGVETPGSVWYQKSYWLMFFATHMASPIFNCFIIISLFLSVAMTADRVFALVKPFAYKNIDHGRHQKLALSICCLIGVSVNIFEVKRWRILDVDVGQNNRSYQGKFDADYLGTSVAIVFGHLRTSVRLAGVVCLIILNIAMVLIYRKRTKKVGQMTTSNDKKEQERKNADKTLLILTIYESLLMAFGQIPHTTHLILSVAKACYGPTYGVVVGPFVDTCVQIADALDFFLVIGINKKMRKTILGVLPCFRKGPNPNSTGSTVPATSGTGLGNGNSRALATAM